MESAINEFGTNNDAKIDGNEYPHKINQRISSLVSDSTVRQGDDYMDAAQIAMQVSWLDRRHSTIDDETGLNSVVVQMMEQFKALIIAISLYLYLE